MDTRITMKTFYYDCDSVYIKLEYKKRVEYNRKRILEKKEINDDIRTSITKSEEI